jgi:putative PIN family toxin of toxin-antitoxin system
LAALAAGAFENVTSLQILEEIRDTLLSDELRPYQRLRAAEIEELLDTLERVSLLVPGATGVTVCRDPDDDKFFAAAIEGAAFHIVSGDADVQAVKEYRGITVLNPAAFLRALGHPVP